MVDWKDAFLILKDLPKKKGIGLWKTFGSHVRASSAKSLST